MTKKPLTRLGQVGLMLLVASMTAGVFVGGSVGFVAIICAIVGFYLLTHQDFSLRDFFSVKPPPKKGKP